MPHSPLATNLLPHRVVYDAMQQNRTTMTLRRTLAAALAALPAVLSFAVYSARLSDFALDLHADDLDLQLQERNDD